MGKKKGERGDREGVGERGKQRWLEGGELNGVRLLHET